MDDADWIVIFIVLAVFWGLIATVAKAKNRSAFAWILLSLIISPLLTLIIIIFMSRVPEEVPRVEYQFSGEQELSNDSYQLYLTKKYAIEKNDVLSKYIVGENSFADVSSALSYAHNMEKQKSQIKKSITKRNGSIECGKCGGSNASSSRECRYCKHELIL